ncbi:universal stress protein [Meridianimarinicoccus aquatilis]|uniref:Universal stress protein n=1 Tax=Meridianimarinicoccus aquatilis TaxID=2552766 RepID=A0A4V3BBA9_9RHOB|nr:universal stress protein [Fluviibacterium aquatile]QIE42755.1 universal stress protein [Rhodobacteraceae bacterium SC52]TDL86089.1 universal stress protein [Fluviibacterium aquatile]
MSGVVLCALDISQPDHEAPVLRRAAQLAKLDGARLDVMTVLPDYGTSMVGSYFKEGFHDKLESEAAKSLSDLVEKTLGAEENASVRHVVATGTVYEQVLKVAKTDGADLIVIGSHRPVLRDYLLGPNASRVVRHSNCSVYVVRDA